MSADRFHKAARDGLLDVLKEATKREVNSKDVDGMTPVLWAAFEGKLDALRLLVGRGGDPDKSDQFGNTALHLSAAKGHMPCVDFLIKFGVNIYALDIDHHSAKDLASINNREDILRYLDSAAGSLEATDRKKAKSLKEKATKQSEKRATEYNKKQQKYDQEVNNEDDFSTFNAMPHRPSTVLTAWKQRLFSGSQGNLQQQAANENTTSNSNTFSSLVGGTISRPKGAVHKKAQQALKNKQHAVADDFKIGETESNGKRTVTSLSGLRRGSEVIYVGTFAQHDDTGKRGKITDVFDVETGGSENFDSSKGMYGTMSRAYSQPDYLDISNDDELKDEVMMIRPSGLFDRPMLGSLAFPRSVTAALAHLATDNSSTESNESPKQVAKPKLIKPRSQLVLSDSDSENGSSSETDDQEDGSSPLERFLAAHSLDEYFHIFQKQEIDLDTLLILTEDDLKSLGLPLGPFRRLNNAIEDRKNAFSNPGPITDSKL